jgi:hypothetical protein
MHGRGNRKKMKMETNLTADIKRIQSLEAELIKTNCAWKGYNREKKNTETDLRS